MVLTVRDECGAVSRARCAQSCRARALRPRSRFVAPLWRAPLVQSPGAQRTGTDERCRDSTSRVRTPYSPRMVVAVFEHAHSSSLHGRVKPLLATSPRRVPRQMRNAALCTARSIRPPHGGLPLLLRADAGGYFLVPPVRDRRATRTNTYPPHNSGRGSTGPDCARLRDDLVPLRPGLRFTSVRPCLAAPRPVSTLRPR